MNDVHVTASVRIKSTGLAPDDWRELVEQSIRKEIPMDIGVFVDTAVTASPVAAVADPVSTLSLPYFDTAGNEGTLGEIHS